MKTLDPFDTSKTLDPFDASVLNVLPQVPRDQPELQARLIDRLKTPEARKIGRAIVEGREPEDEDLRATAEFYRGVGRCRE
jgi:hypothetical protein